MMNNLERLRSENPLVICYTNDVVKNFTANGLLSLGASPAMSEAPEEAEDFTRMASALLINIGTLTRENEGNASEILTLIDFNTTMKGTDSDSELDSVNIAKKAANTLNTAIVITGKDDIIAKNEKIIKLSNGSPLLTKITGAGCLLGGVLASFLFRNTQPSIDLLVEAVSVYNIAAEFAEQAPHVNGPSTFLSELLDQLYQMNDSTYKNQVKKVEI